jgi:hypothetical protein
METTTKSQRKGGWFRTFMVYCACAALFLFYARYETSSSVYDADSTLVEIERFNPVIENVVGWGALIFALSLLILCCFSFSKGWLRWPGIGLAIGFALYPYAVICHAVNNLAPWTVHGQIETEDGDTYVFCNSSFLQGQTMAIAEIATVSPYRTSYRVLVDNNGDSPRSWASLIRPEKSADDYGQLYLCKDFLIGVRYDNRCYLAFDLKNQQRYGHEIVESLPPFLCLNDSDKPNASDTQRIINRIQKYAVFCATTEDVRHASGFLNGELIPGCPNLTSVRRGLQHGNTKFSAIAKRIDDAYSDAFAKLRPRVERYVKEQVTKLDASDADERRDACEALGGLRQSAAVAVPHLDRLIRTENNASVKIQASQTLGLIGDDAIPALLSLAKSDDSTVQSDALFGLSAAGTAANTPEVVKLLRSKAGNSNSHNRVRIDRLLQSFKLQRSSATD